MKWFRGNEKREPGPFKEEDAQRELEKVEKKTFADWFCPLINGLCRVDCICYVKPHLEENSYDEHGNFYYSIHGNYCSNAMFTCDRTVTNTY